MPNTTHINTPQIGMNTDNHDFNMGKGQYSFALNAVVEDTSGNGFPQIQNEASSIRAVNFPAGFMVMGKKFIPELDRTIYALINPTTNASEIGEVQTCHYNDDKEDINGTALCCGDCLQSPGLIETTPLEESAQTPYCTYRTIISATCLNFNIDHPVDIEYRVTNSGVNIYFVDTNNPLRFLYFDLDVDGNLVIQDRFKEVIGYDEDNCDVPIYGTALDCNKIRYNPDFSRPCIELVDVVSGGNLKEGSYQALVAYSDKQGVPLTKYFVGSGVVPIKTKDIKIETNLTTDKALAFKINNLEQSNVFGYYNIVIAETIDNFTTFKLAATLPVTQETFTYTGNSLRDLVSEDVFFQRPIYRSAASVTKANDFLFFARLKEYKRLNLQRVANKVKLYWQTKAIPEQILRNPKTAHDFKGYMRDEVYPFGIVFEFTDDNDSLAFHIPGPSKEYFLTTYSLDVDATINNNDVITDDSCADLPRNKTWQVYNTAKLVGEPHLYSTSCFDDNCWEWGDFAYNESTRFYPNEPEVWGELCGLPIRHHKFPDSLVTHIHDGLVGTKEFKDNNIVYPIGVKVDHDSIIAALDWAVAQGIISASDRTRIRGYRIVRGNRFGNKSVVAKGLLYDMWYYDKDGKRIYYPNFSYNDVTSDTFLAPDDSTYDESNTGDPNPSSFTRTGRYTFHSPDVHFTNPELGRELKIETEEYGQSEGFFNLCEEQPKYKLLSTSAYTLAFAYGVAAALSALEEKECRTYTVKSDYISNQDDSTIDSSVNGNTPVGVVTGTSPGATATVITPSPFSATGNATIDHGETTETHNDLSFQTYNKKSGNLETPAIDVESYTATTCKGSTYQVLNSNSGLGGLGSLLGGIVIPGLNETVNGVIYRTVIGLKEMQVMLDLFESLVPAKNLTIQYNSAGKYNNYRNILNGGFKRRRLDTAEYLSAKNVIVTEDISGTPTTIRINNWNRETSVYLKTDVAKPFFPSTTTVDDSKVSMDDVGLGYNDLNVNVYRTIASYYGSIKNFVPDQYGTVYNIDYLETDGCSVKLSDDVTDCKTFFGGDTFINRFALKRKHPFFIQTRFGMGDGSDVEYQYLGNSAFPNYYFNTKQPLFERLADLDIGDIFGSFTGFLQNVLNVPKSRLDARVNNFFYQKGYIHLYNYGVPYFLVESDVNVDLRHGENNKERDFYPHQRDLSYWLQEKNVPITEDNYYFYNKSYSKQNTESALFTLKPEMKFNNEAEVTHDTGVIYTDKLRTNLIDDDNWRIIRANNFFEAAVNHGKVISVDGIENDKVLVRGENLTQIFSAFDVINTDAGSLQVGKGGMFEGRVQSFSVTDLGYMGSQHRDILKTEFGHVWVDAKRGQVFLLQPGASGMEEISRNGKRNWFKQNLPFQIAKDFNISFDDLDNNFKGIGLHLCFDKRFGRILLTKLDYKKISNDVTYDTVTKKFMVDEEEVSLTDTRYFCNKSWTVSYNFMTKTWVSYHSYTPNYYVEHIDFFDSGYNSATSTLSSHGLTNKSYQVYNGVLYPFMVDVLSEASATNNVLDSVEFLLDVVRYHNEYDVFHNRQVTFNKAIVYNDRQNSGLLKLIPKNEDDFSTVGQYPNVTNTGIEIEVSNSENIWRFNDFFDAVSCTTNNIPVWLNSCTNAYRYLNPKALDYGKDDFNQPRIRGRVNHVRLINDKWSNYKFIFFFNQFNQRTSFR